MFEQKQDAIKRLEKTKVNLTSEIAPLYESLMEASDHPIKNAELLRNLYIKKDGLEIEMAGIEEELEWVRKQPEPAEMLSLAEALAEEFPNIILTIQYRVSLQFIRDGLSEMENGNDGGYQYVASGYYGIFPSVDTMVEVIESALDEDSPLYWAIPMFKLTKASLDSTVSIIDDEYNEAGQVARVALRSLFYRFFLEYMD